MCGISGLYSTLSAPDKFELHQIGLKINNALLHRGPETGDVWQDSEVPLVLGHRRLAIVDLSPTGAQPMESQSGRYIIVFNGEIYNFQALRAELQALREHRFRGQSDTEIILAAIEAWGFVKTLRKLSGMFAIALWDKKMKSLHLARDRMGKKPLYFGWAGSTFLFASELKSFCAHPDFRRDIRREALTAYTRFGYVPAPLCIYDQVWQLRPGGYLNIDVHLLRGGQEMSALVEFYWRAKDSVEQSRKLPLQGDQADAFEDLLMTCVKERMVADVPLGAFLSGGIDSSVVVALMQKQSTQKIKTYTIGFEEGGYNEAEHATQIAKHLGTDHHALTLTQQDALDLVPQLATTYDEPFADASALPTCLVAKFARRDVTVALSGDGGDEMLGGYNRHIAGPKCWNTVQNIPPWLRKPFADMIQSVPAQTWSKLRGRENFGSHLYKFAQSLTKSSEGDVYLAFLSQWQNPKELVKGGRESLIPLVDPLLQVDGLSFAEEMMYWDVLSYLPDGILTKVDRATMAVSMEARAPLLDTRIFEFVWRLPLEQKIVQGRGKWLLRQVLSRHVPEDLFDRPKQGFSVPIDAWLRGELREWAEELLDEKRLKEQGYFEVSHITKIWDEHKKGKGSHGQKLWNILMFQAWHERWCGGKNA